MMSARFAVVLLGLIAGLVGPTHGAGAGEATDQLRAQIDSLRESVRPSAPRPAGQQASTARAVADRMFDWAAMAEASLRGYWKQRTPAERVEFTALFAELFSRAYLSRIHLIDAQSFEYLGDTTTGDRGIVKTRVLTRRGTPIAVDYVVRATPARQWQVNDVRVETISLLENYRVQFEATVAKSSYEELVTRLRAATR